MKYKVGDKVRILSVHFRGRDSLSDEFKVGDVYEIESLCFGFYALKSKTSEAIIVFTEDALELVEEEAAPAEQSQDDVFVQLLATLKTLKILTDSLKEMEPKIVYFMEELEVALTDLKCPPAPESMTQEVACEIVDQVLDEASLDLGHPVAAYTPAFMAAAFPAGKIVGISSSGPVFEDLHPRLEDQYVAKDKRRTTVWTVQHINPLRDILLVGDGKSRWISPSMLEKRYRRVL